MISTQAYKITVNEHDYHVVVGDLRHSPVTVAVNGRSYQVDVTTEQRAAPPTTETINAPPPGPAAARGGGNGRGATVVRAPMPGHILDVNVTAGEKVKMGQILCALEAMKMKNAIRAPQDGVLAAVNIADGQTVSHGDVLFTMQ